MQYGPVTYQSNLPALGAAILAKLEVSKKSLPALMEEQATRLSFDLFHASAATAPTPEYLDALPASRGYRIRHPGRPLFTEGYALLTYKRGARKGEYRHNRKGQIAHKLIGVEGEISRRQRHAGFQAAGWVSSRVKTASLAASVGQKPNRAVIEMVLTGDVLSVAITNTSPAALEVAERTGYMTRAVVRRIQDLETYTAQKAAELGSQITSLTLPAPR